MNALTARPNLTRRWLARPLAAVAAAAALLAGMALPAAPALAAPPSLTTQVPGYYRASLGEFDVTALYDGFVDLPTSLLKGIQAADMQSLLARMFVTHTPGVQTAVNAYLIHTGEHLVLVDTGAAQCFGPTVGQMLSNLRAAGYQPQDVDTVLLTHLHPDHLCGLLDAQGQPAFPKAKVLAAQADADFWLNEKVADAAPKDKQGFFQLARQAVAPYQASGRFQTFAAGTQQLLPGISAVPSQGHTPGHTSYLVSSKSRQLLVWGDIVHSHAVQFAHPEVSLEFDTDAKQAIATRRALFQEASKQGWMIAGAHLPFPGLGRVRQDGKRYAWVPVEFGPVRAERR